MVTWLNCLPLEWQQMTWKWSSTKTEGRWLA